MKILQVVPFFSPVHGGSAIVPYYLSRELTKRGHEVAVFTSDYKLSRKWTDSLGNIEVYSFKAWSSWAKFYFTPTLIKIAKDKIKNFDLVHMHNYRTFQNIVVFHYAKKYGVPCVLQAHGSLPRIMARQRLKQVYDVLFGYRLFKGVSKVIALSWVEAEQYKSMGVPDEKIAIIPNGIDLSEYADLAPKGSFKKKVGVKRNQRIVLYLGRIHKTKGIDFLIEAYALLIKDSRFHDVTLVIAGPNDGYLSEARTLTNALGVSNRVLFTGFLNEYEKVSALCDSSIVVSPEKFNVFLIVPLEAAALGKPVIVSNTNYISHIVREGKFGFSVDYGNTKELAEKMGKLLGNSNFTIDMSQNGRSFVSKNFNWNKIISSFEKVYKDVIEN